MQHFIYKYEHFVAILNSMYYNNCIFIIRIREMSISYNKLWKLLIDKNMTKTDLRLRADIATSTLAKLSKNEHVSMDVLIKICNVLNCGLDDIVEISKEEN